MLSSLSRDQRIAVIGIASTIAVAVIIGVSAFFVPEVRQFLRLEKPPQKTSPFNDSLSQAPQLFLKTQNTEPPKSEPTKTPKTTTQNNTTVKGNNNVAGNNVEGNGNALGNNDTNQTGPRAIAPNGIAISGGNVDHPTVNNFTQPPRRLAAEQQNQAASCLRKVDASGVFVAFAQHNFEAQTYSDDFVAALKTGGWTVRTYGVPYTETRVGSGVQVQVADPNNAPHAAVVLAQCLTEANIKVFGMKSDILPSDGVMLYVGVPIEGSDSALSTHNSVNSKATPPRRLSDEQRLILIPCLQMKTGVFTASAIMNNSEAFRYAQDFSEAFTASGWKNEQQTPVQSIWVVGAAWTGVHFKFAGTWDEVAKRAVMLTGSPEWNALDCVGKIGMTGAEAAPFQDVPTGSFRIEVAEHP